MAVTELLGFIFNVWVLLSAVALVVLKQSVRFVPQNTALVVERFGKYRTTMEAGLNFLVPFRSRRLQPNVEGASRRCAEPGGDH